MEDVMMSVQYTAPEEKNPLGCDLSEISIGDGQVSLAYTGDEEEQSDVLV